MQPERFMLIDTDEIKRVIDLYEFVNRYTKLVRVSARGEYAGPCPRCGGEDRFHVKGDRFFCRQCYPRGGDIIDLVQMLHNLSFREACVYLQNDASFSSERPAVPQAQPEAYPKHDSEDFQDSARRTVRATHRLLLSEKGSPGQSYLLERGLSEQTWRDYQVGYGTTYHPLRQQNMDAIFMPWFAADATSILAIQHRFIDASLKKDERYTLKPGSTPMLFGLQALQPAQALIVVEGEFNCMALHQLGVQAISVGSQSNARRGDVLPFLTEQLDSYERVIFWFDELDVAQQAIEGLRKQQPFREEKVSAISNDHDANDLLMSGELNAVVSDLISGIDTTKA